MRISFGGGPSGNRSLYLLMGLSVVFVIVFWQVINKVPVLFSLSSLNGGRAEMAENRFNDEQKDLMKKRFAGYWEFETDTISETNAVHKTDRIEYKDNGIIWQVIIWEIAMPSGERTTFHHVRTAYCNPFGLTDQGDTICEVGVYKQAVIAGGTTCVDNLVLLETWNAWRREDTLHLCNRSYTRYKGALASFFPGGLLGIVDSVWLRDCNGRRYISEFARTAVAADLEKMKSSGDRADEVRALVERYYIPAVIAENWRGFSKSTLKPVDISFQVTPSGTVTSARLASGRDDGKMYFRGLEYEMATWRFPRRDGEDKNALFRFRFDLAAGAANQSGSNVQ
ncbi:MAG: hypothetical protein JXA71_15975 [Chitinispirillaceae bacterium]|nr:hypothetical protein [Chitinispirillaceae bacterium]